MFVEGEGVVSHSAPEQFRVIHVTPMSWTIGAHEFCSYGWVIENRTNRLNPHLACSKGMKFGAIHVTSEAKALQHIREFLSTYLLFVLVCVCVCVCANTS